MSSAHVFSLLDPDEADEYRRLTRRVSDEAPHLRLSNFPFMDDTLELGIRVGKRLEAEAWVESEEKLS